jgi:KaiC/GvpD/RAD55 family RecA-like ATPase
MFLIRSGIPSLDAMFRPANPPEAWDREEGGIDAANPDATTSICIAGPDGTGKSVLAMHFSSRYVADCHQYCIAPGRKEPLAFYFSSDLAYTKAHSMWKNFRLDQPNTRLIPFRYPQLGGTPLPEWLGSGEFERDFPLELKLHLPENLDDLADYLRGKAHDPQVAFIDLAAHTAGDDWGFIERLLAMMPTPKEGEPRNLLVIDAMEGIETFAGDVDAFGQKSTRRGRVAKLMRLAAPKCHLVLLIEEPSEDTRLAEQFVADVVLRLRATEDRGYSRRTIEIEKARGQSHVRGRHPYVIRDGRGSTTGEQVNFDDPRVEDPVGKYQSYIDVFPSLHSISRTIMENRGKRRERPSERRAGFGIRELDEMLATTPDGAAVERIPHGQDEQGFPCSTVNALIGDANTQKSFLGLAFLGHVFHELVWSVVTGAGEADSRPEWASIIDAGGRGRAGAAVLITTKDENNDTLAERFYNQLSAEAKERAAYVDLKEIPGFTSRAELTAQVERRCNDDGLREALIAYLASRTICRRLEIHDTPSPILFHAIRRAIDAAEQFVFHDFAHVCQGQRLPCDANERAEKGWRIRFVLDDFNSIKRTFGRVHDDPLFLPFLMLNLRREGLSSLIIETQSGRHGIPAMVIGENSQTDLRAMTDYRIYTWHVPDFFGDHRIAIAAIPPMVQKDRKSPVLVRELEWYQPNSRSTPRVNPRFELYAGLDTDKPTLVPLQVHLYGETPAWEAYIGRLDALWKRVFDSPTPQLERDRRTVVLAEKAGNYELMREVCDLHADTNLDYTLIVQIDEFWRSRDAFRPQREYLTRRPSADENRGRDRANQNLRRHWFDGDIGYGLDREDLDPGNVDRIPFVWDFGFLACRERLWHEATEDKTSPRAIAASEGMEEKWRKADDLWKRVRAGGLYQWNELLEAASYVAKWQAAQSRPAPAFDLAMVAPETFSCLVLEMWFSEIYKAKPAEGKRLAMQMKHRSWTETGDDLSLSTLVRNHTDELYCTWLLLAESLDLGAFGGRTDGFGFGGRPAAPNAIVTREWYGSASLSAERDTEDPKRFCRLPGAFTVRGDWFLAVVRGSRSDGLADRALDLLVSSDGNVERLMRGLGLPTRRGTDKKAILSSRLRGWHGSQGPGTLTYEDVQSLGIGPGFHWLWRSNLKRYDATAAVWERWLYRVLRRWKRTREYFGSNWVSGFELYRQMTTGKKKLVKKRVASYEDFQKRCAILSMELDQLKP